MTLHWRWRSPPAWWRASTWCGFALLPAYVASFVAGDDASIAGHRRIARAVVSVPCGLGRFRHHVRPRRVVVSHIVLGRLRQQMPWLTIVIGAVMLVVGIAAIAGWKPRLPFQSPAATTSRSALGMVGFGFTYALVSLSCTLGPFLAVTGFAMQRSFVGGTVTYVTYALGMGVIILALSVSVVLAHDSLVGTLRSMSRAPRSAGVLLVVGVRTPCGTAATSSRCTEATCSRTPSSSSASICKPDSSCSPSRSEPNESPSLCSRSRSSRTRHSACDPLDWPAQPDKRSNHRSNRRHPTNRSSTHDTPTRRRTRSRRAPRTVAVGPPCLAGRRHRADGDRSCLHEHRPSPRPAPRQGTGEAATTVVAYTAATSEADLVARKIHSLLDATKDRGSALAWASARPRPRRRGKPRRAVLNDRA